MVLENSMDAPKSSRQVQDKLYRDIKNSEKGITQTQSVADEILYVLNQLEKNPFVQEVTMSKGSDPVIILYTHEQLLDLQKNCIGSDGSIICVDRTFNLGKVFVTALCYKNRCVIRRKTDSYPVILGPLCLHWDGEKSTYHKFFSHLRSKLNSMDLTFCTDDERALRNALSNNFPQSDFLLCTKHLKDNIRDHLGKKDGCSLKERENIVRAIFSEEEGLVFSKNDVEFLQREDDLSIYFQKYPLFKTYYDKHLHGKLKDYVYIPLRNGTVSCLWTTNNSESMNNRLKKASDWKQLKLPELIERLSSVSKCHTMDLRRSLYGLGNYKLFGQSVRHLVTENSWHQKTPTEKKRHFLKFLTSVLRQERENGPFFLSSDGDFQCKSPRLGAGKSQTRVNDVEQREHVF